ncbi:DUF3795 domain-containing protein [candidate division WOR-3 bacterium]|nr:DUF3795 domain-containing protein [candidate division WOR-3 bacterium]
MMKNAERLGICGLDCMNCSIHLRTDEELEYWKSINVDTEKIGCDGCRSDRTKCHWSGDCELLNCCFYGKKLDFCGECGDFPCKKVVNWISGMAHHKAAVENMMKMKEIGKDEWIKERLI